NRAARLEHALARMQAADQEIAVFGHARVQRGGVAEQAVAVPQLAQLRSEFQFTFADKDLHGRWPPVGEVDLPGTEIILAGCRSPRKASEAAVRPCRALRGR